MASFYFDSSALVKYYIPEVGTHWVKILVDDRADDEWRNTIASSSLSVAEVVAAFTKRHRMREISMGLKAALISRFLRDGRQRCTLLEPDGTVIDTAVQLIQRHPLRAYDAVQLATALLLDRSLLADELPPLTFVSADNVLCEAAQAEGLPTENPNEHE
jgi:predicted nucleic acid-binding protein